MFRRKRPETAEDYLALAERAFEKTRFAEAAALCRQALELEPRNAEAYYGLGMAAAMQEQLAEAVTAFERGVECDPERSDIHYALGAVYEELGRVSEARRCFERVLELEPGDVEAQEKLDVLDGRKPPAASTARADERWSTRLSREERRAGDRLLRLRRAREQAIMWFAGALMLGLCFPLRILWDARTTVPAGRPIWQGVDELDRYIIGGTAVVIVASGIALLATVWRLRRYARSLETEETRSLDIAAYAEDVEIDAFRDELEAERESDLAWAEESRRAKPWSLREVSGAHLVWWVAFALSGGQALRVLAMSDAMANAVIMCAIIGGILKVLVTGMMLVSRAGYRMGVRYYRWWGRGWLPALIAMLPAVFGYLAVADGVGP
jgi:tetratricopeptide (TPR) repeat protein